MTVPRSNSPTSEAATLYDQDYALWLTTTMTQIRQGQWPDVDLSHLLDELADMGRRQKNALKSNLRVVLHHLLKYQYQPSHRSNSWRATLREHRLRIEDELADSPSLRRYLDTVLAACYAQARELAADETGLDVETFPQQCPLALADVLNRQFLPD